MTRCGQYLQDARNARQPRQVPQCPGKWASGSAQRPGWPTLSGRADRLAHRIPRRAEKEVIRADRDILSTLAILRRPLRAAWRLPHPHPRSIAVDEFDAGALECLSDRCEIAHPRRHAASLIVRDQTSPGQWQRRQARLATYR